MKLDYIKYQKRDFISGYITLALNVEDNRKVKMEMRFLPDRKFKVRYSGRTG